MAVRRRREQQSITSHQDPSRLFLDSWPLLQRMEIKGLHRVVRNLYSKQTHRKVRFHCRKAVVQVKEDTQGPQLTVWGLLSWGLKKGGPVTKDCHLDGLYFDCLWPYNLLQIFPSHSASDCNHHHI